MIKKRPFVLSVAGFDPSAGAGILADIKTFEQHEVYGFAVCTALTQQNDSELTAVDWIGAEQIINQIKPLIAKFAISGIKVGIVKDLQTLNEVIVFIRSKFPLIKIVLDPVLHASAGFTFHTSFNANQLADVLRLITLLTPNYHEFLALEKMLGNKRLTEFTNVLLKGGHHPEKQGTDVLFYKGQELEIKAKTTDVYPKHGSGCVLSSAILSNLAKGIDLAESCQLSKTYIETFLNTNTSLLGYHKHDR
ncbi:hydroxymethylpyrimidine/phosphomethylpyrimidine kinase [Desertivirga xinjiangensis]|uniref:hydroxymethylpyrimidine/phosphomethylpyrimidine kinase n=1 Tax=Desertivirga xinjiangensis TaxID=539206 RepID=UPI00210C2646|nr:hydroxymethylpyrimidine/phosphomethylpyrimidine kinase [Pedobacter xinjiangensis]